jgi:hypothetical protein
MTGFILDKATEVAAPAQGGNIPKSCTQVAGWYDIHEKPLPDAFIRTRWWRIEFQRTEIRPTTTVRHAWNL